MGLTLNLQVARVDRSVIEHLSTQGKLDPRGGLCCFWCPNKTLTPPIGAFGALKIHLKVFDALKIVKNRLQLRKLQTPK